MKFSHCFSGDSSSVRGQLERSFSLLSVLSICGLMAGCAAPVESASSPVEEDAGSTVENLTQVDTFPPMQGEAIFTSSWSQNPSFFHEVHGAKNQWLDVGGAARFTQFEGHFTFAKLAACQASFVEMTVFKRPDSASPWSAGTGKLKQFASVSLSGGPNIFAMTITECSARVEHGACDPIFMEVPNDQLAVWVNAQASDGSPSWKIDQITNFINIANCP